MAHISGGKKKKRRVLCWLYLSIAHLKTVVQVYFLCGLRFKLKTNKFFMPGETHKRNNNYHNYHHGTINHHHHLDKGLDKHIWLIPTLSRGKERGKKWPNCILWYHAKVESCRERRRFNNSITLFFKSPYLLDLSHNVLSYQSLCTSWLW